MHFICFARFISLMLLFMQLQCQEIIIDETDVAKAIIDYVVSQSVDKLVLGASDRNAFTR